MLALEMLSPIAVTEKAEVGTGWGRGGDGVRTARSAAGAARLYNLRLPPKASGKDTGPVAGARIEGLPPMPPTPAIWRSRSKVKRCMFQYKQSNGEIGAAWQQL